MLVLATSSDRDAWLAARRNVVTATDVTALVGSNPFKSAHDVWREKQGEETFKGNAKSRIGQALEPALVAWAAEQLPGKVVAGTELYAHADHPWAAATPDGLQWFDGELPTGVVEVKTTTAWESPPQYVLDQVQWQAWVTGAERGWVVRLFGLEDLSLFPVERDEARIGELTEAGYQFYTDHMLTDDEPPTWERPILEGAEYLLDAYKDAHAKIKYLEAAKKGYRDEILLLLGDSRQAQAGKSEVRLSEYKRESVDMNLLRSKYPNIANKCTVTFTVTTLQVN